MRDSIDLVIPAFNAADDLDATIEAIAGQDLPDGVPLRVIVSDDGSTDGTATRVNALASRYEFLSLTSAANNAGRSTACNRGAAAGSGSIIVFCDADCRYSRPDLLGEFVAEMADGADAVLGIVDQSGDGFWAAYVQQVAANRVAAGNRQGLLSFTTANFAIRRTVFNAIGGFCEDYSRYGFEDKDLLLRLERFSPNARIRQDLSAVHDGHFDVDGLCAKAEASGRWSAPVFQRRFPEAYQQLTYAHCDRQTSTLARIVAPLSGLMSSVLKRVATVLVRRASPGFALRLLILRMAICASYLHGSWCGRHPER